MNRRIRASNNSSPSRVENFHKYLKPGALARIRDLRISAISHRVSSLPLISLHHPASPPSSPRTNDGQPLVNAGEGFPCFVGRIRGPRYLQRKKLMAAKSVLLISSSPSHPTADSPDTIIDSFSNDILVAN